jgi:4-amino-4-deoxy-L-arabinose transferase-like glycosyltransferase
MKDAIVKPNGADATPAASSWSLPPFDPFPAAAELLGPKRIEQIVWAFIALGIVVRLIRYLLLFPLWPDEAYLAHNYLDRGYLDLTKPLDFIQIAPVLYLWVQMTFVKVFGFSEYSLRLFPLLCGIGSLFVFRRLAGRLLQGTAYLLTVGTFAVAYPLLRHSAEAKPYGSDIFVTLILLTLIVEWCRRPQSRGWWLALTLVMPLATLMSYPAVFIGGGVSATMASVLWRRGSWQDWLRWGITGAALCAGFLALFALSGGSQMAASGDAQRAAFADVFPAPGTSPLGLAAFLFVNTNRALCYPVGGNDWLPNMLNSFCCLTALFLLIRARRLSLVVLCLVPLALNFVAFVMKCYPYCDPWRLAAYMAPIFCLLMGLGATGLLATIKTRRALGPLFIAIALLAAIAVGASLRDFLKPYKDMCWVRNRDFARWFWCDKAEGAELVCLQNDLHQRFYWPSEGDTLASVYYCNQRIYSARLASGKPAQLDRVSANRPLRCVRFRPFNTTDRDETAFGRWLNTMQSQYRLVAQERYPMSFWVNDELSCIDYVELYEFVPKDASAGPSVAARAGARK